MLELVKYVMLKDMGKSKPRSVRPRDPLALAKVIGDIATGQTAVPPEPTDEEIRRVMSALGKRGGPKGGAARAKSLTKQERRAIAIKGAEARWLKTK